METVASKAQSTQAAKTATDLLHKSLKPPNTLKIAREKKALQHLLSEHLADTPSTQTLGTFPNSSSQHLPPSKM